MTNSKEDLILQTAENMIRESGYNSFSFRKVAEKVGIKSASVHYHFPTKGELAEAVTKRYTENFIQAIGQPQDLHASGKNPIDVYIAAFRGAIVADNGVCLGGMLGAEVGSLPDDVIKATRTFFLRNVEWLEEAYQCLNYKGDINAKAKQTVSLLEGAMIISNVMKDISYFDSSAELLT
ncbi:MAG: TetR/AcrR family transcriptional regulator [Nonlabens ulvanivorans]|uniref:TetR/AcrR family transcriptional regulator n=1 Tax=Nonlabens ulvanivorans TaxID=906888 RepID=UPI003264B641